MKVEKIGDATLYLADALEVMPSLPADSFVMLWTDPPYGHDNNVNDLNARLSKYRGVESKPIANDDADSMRRVLDGVLREAARVLKPNCSCCCCCCCGGGPSPTFAWVADRMDREGLVFFHSVIWDKVNPGLGWRYRRQHEMIMISHRAGGKLSWAKDARPQSNIIQMVAPCERAHPNEKPLALVAKFIALHSVPGDQVIDPFMGSGTTGVAALRAGRRFTGIEIDPAHFSTACRRIEAEMRAPRFDLPPPPKATQEIMQLDTEPEATPSDPASQREKS